MVDTSFKNLLTKQCCDIYIFTQFTCDHTVIRY